MPYIFYSAMKVRAEFESSRKIKVSVVKCIVLFSTDLISNFIHNVIIGLRINLLGQNIT